MQLSFVCIEDVYHLNAVRLKVIRNQRPMTTPPDRLGTHHGGALFTSQIDKSFDASLKFLRLHVIGIPAKRFVPPGQIQRVGPRPPAKCSGNAVRYRGSAPAKE